LLIQINGENREVRDRSTLTDLVGELSLPPARIAIELNHLVVRRDKWAETTLAEGDRIEIVHFVGGGSGNELNKSLVASTDSVGSSPVGTKCL
jgi:thiamine biosynthesis protein ThiS